MTKKQRERVGKFEAIADELFRAFMALVRAREKMQSPRLRAAQQLIRGASIVARHAWGEVARAARVERRKAKP